VKKIAEANLRASACSESIAAKLRIARRGRRGRVWVGAKRAVQRSNLKSGGSVDSTFKNFVWLGTKSI
jgi:hypothetical protein